MAKSKLEMVGLKFKHFGHPVKSKIIQFIVNSGNKAAVSDIYRPLKLEQSVTSTLLSEMRRDGLVKAKKDGRKVFYSINTNYVSDTTEKLQALIPLN